MDKAIIVATKAVCEAAVSITTIIVLSRLAAKIFLPAANAEQEKKKSYSLS